MLDERGMALTRNTQDERVAMEAAAANLQSDNLSSLSTSVMSGNIVHVLL